MWHCVDKSDLWLYLLKNEFSKSKTFPTVGIQKIQQFRKFSLREYFYLSQASTGCLILNRQIISWCAGKVVLSPSAGLGRWDLLTGFQGRFTGLEVLGCAVEDEIGRPDPNEPDGDGRCQSQRTAVSNQVKKYFLLSEAWCNCKIWTDWERITFPSSTSPPSRNLSRYRSHNPQYIGYPEYMKSKFNL